MQAPPPHRGLCLGGNLAASLSPSLRVGETRSIMRQCVWKHAGGLSTGQGAIQQLLSKLIWSDSLHSGRRAEHANPTYASLANWPLLVKDTWRTADAKRPPWLSLLFLKRESWNSQDFPGGPVVKNLSWDAEEVGSIPGCGTKIPHAKGQLSLLGPTTTETLQQDTAWRIKIPCTATETQLRQINR